MNRDVVVSYSGVHDAYQIALAAQEIGCLKKFYCSIYDSNGFWGGWISRIFSSAALMNRRIDGLDTEKVVENPLPLLSHRIKSKIFPSKRNDWNIENSFFDKWVAKKISISRPAVVVATETCAFHSFRMANKIKAKKILDCPQVHPDFLNKIYLELSEKLKCEVAYTADAQMVNERRASEYEMADWMLTYSDIHKKSFIDSGFPPSRIVSNSLWADPRIWFPNPVRKKEGTLLKLLFVGGVSLRKGIPFLFEAMSRMKGVAELTVVGSINPEIKPWLERMPKNVALRKPMDRLQLRNVYCEHDLLVLPSLVDAFGFVAMEAMACGLPVVVSENCGVPVPDQKWRVPVMQSDPMCARFEHYFNNKEELERDSSLAIDNARSFTPERYRVGVTKVIEQCLHCT